MLTTSEMIFGMVGLLILLVGGVGIFGRRMLGRLRSRQASRAGNDSSTSDRSRNEVPPS
jgi:hypothetical protein